MRKVMNVTEDKRLGHEVNRAEYYLNGADPFSEDGPRPVTIALAVIAFALLMITKAANASLAPPVATPASLASDNCSMHLKTIIFSGTFALKNGGAAGAESLRFVIGEPENDKNGTAGSEVAQIWSGSRCQASCSSIAFEKGDLSMPISLDLQCHGEALGPLSAHVAVLWDHGNAHSTLLRFGSWLEGYEQATMKVEVDHFNTMSVASRADMNMPAMGH